MLTPGIIHKQQIPSRVSAHPHPGKSRPMSTSNDKQLALVKDYRGLKSAWLSLDKSNSQAVETFRGALMLVINGWLDTGRAVEEGLLNTFEWISSQTGMLGELGYANAEEVMDKVSSGVPAFLHLLTY